MINGLNEYEKYKVLRPIIGEYQLNDYAMPIIRNSFNANFDWDRLEFMSYRSLSPKQDNSYIAVHMFRFDKELERLWSNPLKYVPIFQCCAAVATPVFSLYPSMNINDIRHNIYRSRWLGYTWQNFGCKVLPTVGWVTPDTYDICFGAIEEGCPVIISTLGCADNIDVFLSGFDEMKKRIHPSLIIVYGKMLSGITGTILHIPYSESFARRSFTRQMRMTEVPRTIIIKETR